MIEIEFLGALAKFAGQHTVILELDQASLSVKGVISELIHSLPSEFEQNLINSALEDPRPNALILVNHKEISALDGLETKVKNGDKLVLVPVSHGG